MTTTVTTTGITFNDGSVQTTAAPSSSVSTITGTGTINLNFQAAVNHKYTLTGDTVLSISSIEEGQSGRITLTQDGTGGHHMSFADGVGWEFPKHVIPHIPGEAGGQIILEYYCADASTVIITDWDRDLLNDDTPSVVEVHSVTTSGGTEITIPSTVRPGDLMILCAGSYFTSTANAPNVEDIGWTRSEAWAAGTGGAYSVFYKIADEEDGGKVVPGQYGEVVNYHVLYVVRGPERWVSVRNISDYAISDSNPASSTTGTIGWNDDGVVVGMVGTRDSTPTFSTESPALTNVQAARPIRVGINVTTKGTTPTQGTYDMNDLGVSNFTYAAAFRLWRELRGPES